MSSNIPLPPRDQHCNRSFSNQQQPSCSLSESSRHPLFTQHPFPTRSIVRDGQTSLLKPRLDVSHSTCLLIPQSPSPLYDLSLDTQCATEVQVSLPTHLRQRHTGADDHSFHLSTICEQTLRLHDAGRAADCWPPQGGGGGGLCITSISDAEIVFVSRWLT